MQGTYHISDRQPGNRKHPQGFYRVDIRYKDARGISRRKQKEGFERKRDAEEYAYGFLLNLSRLQANLTFAEAYGRFKQDHDVLVKQGTARMYESAFRLHLLPYFGAFKLPEITPAIVQAWATEKAQEPSRSGRKNASLPIYKACLSTFFNYCVRMEFLLKNPAANVKLPPTPRRDYTLFSVPEFEKAMRFLREYPSMRRRGKALTEERAEAYEMAFRMMFYLGLRVGEVLALRPDDVTGKTVRIDKTATNTTHLAQLVIQSTPKTESSNRIVCMPKDLAARLKEYILKWNIAPGRQIFEGLSTNGLINILRRACKLSGLPRLRNHDLRHSHANVLRECHVDMRSIADQLGHKSIKTTMDIYAHRTNTSMENIVGVLDALQYSRCP